METVLDSPTQTQALFEQKFLVSTHIDQVQDERLRSQLLDWAVSSGPFVAIQNLQGILGLELDGLLGPDTLELVNKADPKLLGNNLVTARVKMICRVITKSPSQLKSLSGLVSRALEFLS